MRTVHIAEAVVEDQVDGSYSAGVVCAQSVGNSPCRPTVVYNIVVIRAVP